MNIYVGNLSLEVTEEVLRQEFMRFGQVTSVSIMDDKYIGSGQSKGYGFVEMPFHSEGEAAIRGINGRIMVDRALNVVEALPLSQNRSKGPLPGKKASHFRVRQRRSKIG